VGVQRIRAGQVRVLGQPAGSPGLRRKVAYMTQAPSVYGDLTIRENAAYFASLNGLTAEDAHGAIATVGLTRLRHQLVSSLSGGERARASLACALVGRPEVLVLDEPTVGQDPLLREELWQRFHALAAAGTTVLVSSHVMDEASRCDRLLLIREGRLLAVGTPDEIREGAGARDMDEAFLKLVRAQGSMAES
jgi:ABC-2 type transport system ATP-binding protein